MCLSCCARLCGSHTVDICSATSMCLHCGARTRKSMPSSTRFVVGNALARSCCMDLCCRARASWWCARASWCVLCVYLCVLSGVRAAERNHATAPIADGTGSISWHQPAAKDVSNCMKPLVAFVVRVIVFYHVIVRLSVCVRTAFITCMTIGRRCTPE